MSNAKLQSPELTPRQVSLLLEEIASTSLQIQTLGSILFDLGDVQERDAVIRSIIMAAGKVGLMAETYSVRCGQCRPAGVNGGIDEWLMTPAWSRLEPVDDSLRTGASSR